MAVPDTMIFSWLKQYRRRRLWRSPFPAPWLEVLNRNVYHYAHLSDAERGRLREIVRVLAAEKNWEGCGGLRMNDEVRVTIAGQAALLLLGFRSQYFDMLQSILVYPDAYAAPEQVVTGAGVVLEGESHREGEAWYRGPVILSWADALAAGRGESAGSNVVLHEFAHQLDMQNGQVIDGAPALGSPAQYQRWHRVVRSEYDRLVQDCRRGRETLLDCYGTQDVGEFFAVSTECFFEQPQAMRQWHPELYEIFREYYQQDPAASREDA